MAEDRTSDGCRHDPELARASARESCGRCQPDRATRPRKRASTFVPLSTRTGMRQASKLRMKYWLKSLLNTIASMVNGTTPSSREIREIDQVISAQSLINTQGVWLKFRNNTEVLPELFEFGG